jgi:hypothetical protein
MILMLGVQYACLCLCGVAWALTSRNRSKLGKTIRSLFALVPVLFLFLLVLKEHGPSPLYAPLALHAGSFSWVGGALILAYITLIPGRNLLKLARIKRAETGMLENSRRVPWLERDAEIRFEALAAQIGFRAPPEIYACRLTAAEGMRDTALAMGIFHPIILIRACWLDPTQLGNDAFWGHQPPKQKTKEELQVILAHELGHLIHWHGWLGLFQNFSSLLLPWSWTYAPERTETTTLAKRLSSTLGWCWARGNRAERDQQEDEADSVITATRQHLVGSLARLRNSASQSSSTPTKEIPTTSFASSAFGMAWGLSALLLSLWICPGREDLMRALGLERPYPGVLPRGWNVRLNGHAIQYGVIPCSHQVSENRVWISRVDAPFVPETRQEAALEFRSSVSPGDLIGPGILVLEMEVDYEGALPFNGWELAITLNKLAPDPVTLAWSPVIYQKASAPLSPYQRFPPPRVGPNRYRFRAELKLPDRSFDVFNGGFLILNKATYVFHPPKAWIERPNGRRDPVPSI